MIDMNDEDLDGSFLDECILMIPIGAEETVEIVKLSQMSPRKENRFCGSCREINCWRKCRGAEHILTEVWMSSFA